MTNEEKSYCIQKIESYKNLIDKEKKKLVNEIYLLGVFSALALYFSSLISLSHFVYGVLTLGSTCLGANVLKEMIQSISKKTMFEGKIEDINFILERLESNESRGMRK